MIAGPTEIARIFSIFHDGGIASYCMLGTNLELEVEITYLAQLVNPEYRFFRITLHDVSRLEFKTWPKSASSTPSILKSTDDIFANELEVLSGEACENTVRVLCNQPSSSCNYCGGELMLETNAASVKDESGKTYSIVELSELSEKYWFGWEARNRESRNV